MIIIAKLNEAGSPPERQLTPEEKAIVIARWGDANNYYYFTDADRVNNIAEWQAYQLHQYPIPTLAELKAKRLIEVDTKTGGKIVEGFSFGGGNWSLSVQAQSNWHRVSRWGNEKFPYTIYDRNLTPFVLTILNIDAFIQTGENHIKSLIESGNVLKISINTAPTVEALNLIIDNR